MFTTKMDLLRPKSRQEIENDFRNKYKISKDQWDKLMKLLKAPFNSKHFVLWWGFPTIVLGVSMAISLFTCIPPSSSYTEYKTINKSEWLEYTGDSTYVGYKPPLEIEMPSKNESTKHERDSIQNEIDNIKTKDWLAVEIPPKKRSFPQIHLPKIYKSDITFFKRVINIFYVGIIILLTGVFIIVPIVCIVKNYENGGYIDY